MKPFILHILFFVVICLFLANCKHEPPKPPEEVCHYDSSIEEMKQWYYFKDGTQWIYQEQNTGALDTAIVYQSYEGDDWFDYKVLHSFGGWTNHYNFYDTWTIYCLTVPACDCRKVKKSRFKPGNYIGEGRIFVFPHIVGNYNNIVGYPNSQMTAGRTTLISDDSEFIIENDTIKNTVIWDVTTDQSVSGWPTQYSIGKNVGILSITIPQLIEDWQLIEYHIIQ